MLSLEQYLYSRHVHASLDEGHLNTDAIDRWTSTKKLEEPSPSSAVDQLCTVNS